MQSKKVAICILGIWIAVWFIIAKAYSPCFWAADEYFYDFIPLKAFVICFLSVWHGVEPVRSLYPWIYQFLYCILPGYLLSIIFPKCKYLFTLCIAALAAFIFNAIRFHFHLGYFDATDIIFNVCGAMLGRFIYNKRHAVNIVAFTKKKSQI